MHLLNPKHLLARRGVLDRRGAPRSRPRPGTEVLIVDDSRTVVAILKRMLRQSGYETLEAFDAESAIRMAQARLPSLIFMDVVLPGINGFQATRVLSRTEATAGIPIVVMSGNEQATEQFWVLRIGAAGFMKKPFSRGEVFRQVERVLGRRGAA